MVDSFNCERNLNFADQIRSLDECQTPHSCSIDQGGFRTLHHIVRCEVRWCFFSVWLTLIRVIVWIPLPFVIVHVVLELFGENLGQLLIYTFWARILFELDFRAWWCLFSSLLISHIEKTRSDKSYEDGPWSIGQI